MKIKKKIAPLSPSTNSSYKFQGLLQCFTLCVGDKSNSLLMYTDLDLLTRIHITNINIETPLNLDTIFWGIMTIFFQHTLCLPSWSSWLITISSICYKYTCRWFNIEPQWKLRFDCTVNAVISVHWKYNINDVKQTKKYLSNHHMVILSINFETFYWNRSFNTRFSFKGIFQAPKLLSNCSKYLSKILLVVLFM